MRMWTVTVYRYRLVIQATQRHPTKGQVILAQWLASEIATLFHVMQPIDHHNNRTVAFRQITNMFIHEDFTGLGALS